MTQMEKIFTEGWERRLETQFLKNDRCRKRAYICSPLSAETDEEVLANMRAARAYMLYAMEEMGYAARAPHAYLPMLLCDRVAAERALALQFGLRLLEDSEILLVCGSRISSGMRGEILHAASLRIPAAVFDTEVYREVQKAYAQNGAGGKRMVRLDRGHFPMALSSPASDTGKGVQHVMSI